MIQDNSATFPPANSPVTTSNGNLTQTWMGFFRALFNRTGQGTGVPNQVSNVTTDGQTVTTDWVFVDGAGVTTLFLPDLFPGELITVQTSATVLGVTINPPAGFTIDGNPNYVLAASKMQVFRYFSTTQIFSMQLG